MKGDVIVSKLWWYLVACVFLAIPVFVRAETEAPKAPEVRAAVEETPPVVAKADVAGDKKETSETSSAAATDAAQPDGEEADQEVSIADPIEPFNRAMFVFNDKLYFWLLKPVAKGYNAVVPEPARISVSNFFNNITMPVRFVNSLLQAKIKSAGIELARFTVNTLAGTGGLFEPAKEYDLLRQDEDLGQTLGTYGMGNAFYIVWPFLGPSTVRDSVGRFGDGFLNPVNYVSPAEAALGIHAYDRINDTSLRIGEYEDLKEAAIDPYIAVRDAYIQNRKHKVEE